MILDPGQRSFSQFPGAGLHGLMVFHVIQPLAREALGKHSRLVLQRLHSGAPALLAKEAGLMSVVKCRLCAKRRVASHATIKAWQPAAKPHRPEGKVAERQGPITGAFNFPSGQQDQPEHRLRNFVLRQNELRYLADHRQPGAEIVIALGLMKGLEQFGLLDAHEIASFLLDVPDLDVRENLERRAVAVLQAPRTRGHSAYSPRRTAKKTHQAVRFAQGEGL